MEEEFEFCSVEQAKQLLNEKMQGSVQKSVDFYNEVKEKIEKRVFQ